jgi:hypothetical protein
VLEAGLFRPVHSLPGQPKHAVNWERVIPEEATVVSVSLADGSLELNLSPAISAYAHHHGKRLAASVYFEIAAKYAEKVDGRIVQRATVVGCKSGDNPEELLLAKYPSLPMSFDRVCAGFREALILGAGRAEFIDHAEAPGHDGARR